MCGAYDEKELVNEAEDEDNNFVESFSKEISQAAFDPLKLYPSFVYETVSIKVLDLNPVFPLSTLERCRVMMGKLYENVKWEPVILNAQEMSLDNESYVADISLSQVEEMKSCTEGDYPSTRSSMRAKEINQMEELSMGGCSSIGSNMEFDEQDTNPKSVSTDMTSVKGHDYFIFSASISNGTSVTKDIVYKPLSNTTRRFSLKLLRLSNNISAGSNAEERNPRHDKK
ncbi:hypothetical protein Cgig2_021304 [Carnegiea gigantea]|uniref:Uncharacterized protein n=1 Tax=Carnegiea gigantea TaxID=171969 RepID=A0A9Q1JHR9_9CARY|nr:hypothetical protein Cgig2_021304 [Carnegiea gigantea]